MYHKSLLLVLLCFSIKLEASRLLDRLHSFEFKHDSKLVFSEKFGLRLNDASLRPHPLLRKFNIHTQKTKKYVAAALAFPFPFGIVGLHRIYLGCQPYVPVAYIATVGGGFGVLPFIDFCAILSHKNTDPFVDNKKVFMWIK